MTKLKAVFFDQDNTIVNTALVSPSCYLDAIKYIAPKTDYDAEIIYKKWLEVLETVKNSQNPKERFFDYSLGLVFKELGISTTLIPETVNKQHELLKERIELNPGVAEFMRKEIGLIKVVFTEDNYHGCEIKIDKFSLKFDLIVTSDEIGVMKPDIRYLEYAWEKLELKPDECIYVGDNWEKDCELGQLRGGIGVVFGKKDKRANFEISDMMELEQIISSVNN